MQNYNWDLKTQFVFPEEYGLVEDVVSVDIKPRFQLIETEESLRLVGIYHITSTVLFDPHELPEYSEGTLIEHIELNGDNGYFEYAVPLEVNLPKERIPVGCHPELYVEDIQFDVSTGSSATFNWDVSCIIPEPVVEVAIEEEEIENIQFDSYLESNNISLEIPSASAFADLIQDLETDKLEEIPVSVEPVANEDNEDNLENDLVLNEDNQENELVLNEGNQENELVLNEDNQENELVLNEDTNEDTIDEASFDNTSYVETFENTSYEESIGYFEPETFVQSSNIIVPEQEIVTAKVEQANNELESFNNEIVQSENFIPEEKEVDLAFDADDFFSSLSESYTLLDLKSNKISPKEPSDYDQNQ